MASSIFRSSVLAVLLLTLAQESHAQLVPEGLLDFVPAACQETLNTDVLPCAIENLCFALFPTDEEIAAIPVQTEIQSCVDVELGLCPITSRCLPCQAQANDFFKCFIFESAEGSISQEIIDLVSGCSLDCTSTPEPVVLPETEVPVPAPTDPVSYAPSDAPFDSELEATEVPTAISGAVNMMVSTVAIACGVLSFMSL